MGASARMPHSLSSPRKPENRRVEHFCSFVRRVYTPGSRSSPQAWLLRIMVSAVSNRMATSPALTVRVPTLAGYLISRCPFRKRPGAAGWRGASACCGPSYAGHHGGGWPHAR